MVRVARVSRRYTCLQVTATRSKTLKRGLGAGSGGSLLTGRIGAALCAAVLGVAFRWAFRMQNAPSTPAKCHFAEPSD